MKNEDDLVAAILAARDAGRTRGQTAKALHLSPSVFLELIRKHLIDGWPESPKELVDKKREASKEHVGKICELRDDGLGQRAIAKKLGVSRWTVQDTIRHHNIPWPDRERPPAPSNGFVASPAVRQLSKDEQSRYRELRVDFGLPSHEAFAQLERERAREQSVRYVF